MLDSFQRNMVGRAYMASLKRIEAETAEQSLIDFSEYVWPVVEPNIPFVRGWAIEAIAEHLQAVTEGEITRLLINVPPGFSKSLLTDVFWPAWEWGPRRRPWYRYMCASYSNHLTERDNMRCRNIVISERYQKLWGKVYGISNEQFTKIKFANDKTGWKLATSVGGIGTGERGDRVIIDDPNNPFEMESEIVRRTTNMWFTEIIPDRLNNPKESAIVVIQQRTHEDDVSGTALTREMGYDHLMIPMYYDSARHCTTSLGWTDPRTVDGDIAWPERFPYQTCKDLERDKGDYAWAGQYQQTPEPRGGAIIKRDFWQLWKQERWPTLEFVVASLDTAFTEKEENDFSALTIWGVFREDLVDSTGSESLWMPRDGQTFKPIRGNPKIILMYAWQERLEFHELIQKVIKSCIIKDAKGGHPYFPVDKLLVESKANGQSVWHELYRMFGASGKVGIEAIDPTKYGDKVARVHAIQHLFSDRMVYAPDKSWADMVIDQCAIFPKGSRKDLVDSTSQAMRWLRDSGFALRGEEFAVEEQDSLMYRGASETRSLYEV